MRQSFFYNLSAARVCGVILVFCVQLLTNSIAVGQTVVANMKITTTVQSVCTLSPTSINISQYTGAQVVMNSQINTVCTVGTPYSIMIDGGQNISGSARRMKLTTAPQNTNNAYLSYILTSSGTPWGGDLNSPGGTSSIPSVGTGTTQSIPITVLLPPNQIVMAGTYSDTVVVTLVF
ncbi:Csu type fimbrial protein [Rickettsiales endosymbiont of Peranema trichophorum]|uniref:Csu type fimbrial protein n=1 Tax=Rickettsiales endosymbiont of Peranema trichophorum TaxID=2486577 RepID=UPI0013EE59E3|nr:spore coat protein U domain-containing protein [Rickettsiales endosymbiont of Peranema trichophorum]